MQLPLFQEIYEPDVDALSRCLKARVVAVDVGHAELLGELVAAIRFEAGEGDDPATALLGPAFQMKRADAAADDADRERMIRSHRCSPTRSWTLPPRRRMAGGRQRRKVALDRTGSARGHAKVTSVTSGGQRKRTGGRKTPSPREV